MIFVLATQFHAYLLWVNTSLALCLNRFFNVTAVVAAFNMENVLVVYNFAKVCLQLCWAPAGPGPPAGLVPLLPWLDSASLSSLPHCLNLVAKWRWLAGPGRLRDAASILSPFSACSHIPLMNT